MKLNGFGMFRNHGKKLAITALALVLLACVIPYAMPTARAAGSASDGDIAVSTADVAPLAANIAEGTSGTCTWVIDDAGVLTISPADGVSGTLASTGSGSHEIDWGWKAYAADVTAVKVESTVYTPETALSLFYGLANCKSIDLTGLNTSNTTNTSFMFAGCSSLTSLDVRGLDVSKVTTTSSMFSGCSGLTSINLAGWNTSAVKNMSSMFSSCKSLPSLDVTGFDTSNVTDMRSMFSYCQSLPSLDLTNFITSNVTTMRDMFYNCKNMTAVDVTSFDTSKVTNFTQMFSNCSNLTELDVSGFDTSSATTFHTMFGSCKKLKYIDVSNFDTSKVTEFTQMFSYCSALEAVDVSGFNTQNAKWMNNMFRSCYSLKAVNVSNFDTSNVVDMSWMFESCRSLTELDVSNFDTAKVTSMWSMFNGCKGLTELDVSNFDTAKVTDMKSMFRGCSGLSELDLFNFNTANVTTMNAMFYDCSGLEELDISSFDTSKVTDMDYLFYNDTKLNTISVSADFTPATNYEAENNVNFFNVVDGNLIYTPKTGYAVKSVTVGGQPIEFDVLGGTYEGFEGDSKAVIVFAPAVTVTFVDNGTEVDEQILAQGGDAKDPYADSVPVIDGMRFEGWDKEFTNVQSDITVNAQWVADEYTLFFDVNGGDALPADKQSKTVTRSKAVGELPDATREGYTFGGWLDANGTEYTADTVYTVQGDTTLYAQWTPVSFTVTYVFVGETPDGAAAPSADTVTYGTEYTAKDAASVDGWLFDGWYTSAAMTAKYAPAAVTGDMVLYGAWIDNTITVSGDIEWIDIPDGLTAPEVTIDLMNGTTVVDSVTVPGGDEGYSFENVPRYASVGGEAIAYTVSQRAAANYTTTYSTPVTDADGNIDIDITNTGDFAYGALTVSNEVIGEDAPADAEFTYTVTFDSTVSYPYTGAVSGTIKSGDRITLKDGESITISDILVGVKFTVTQDEEEDFVTSPASLRIEGVIASTPSVAAFTNSYELPVVTGNLTITNKVTGSGADKSLRFPIKVEFSADGSYELRIYGAGETVPSAGSTGMLGRLSITAAGARATTGTIKSGDTIQLAHGETAVIYGLPEGTTYKVTETDSKGYKLTSTGTSGSIAESGAKASLINEKVSSSGSGSEGPKTGDYSSDNSLAVCVVMQVAVLAMLVCVVCMKKLGRENEAEQA